MIKSIMIKTDDGSIFSGCLVDKHYAMYQNVHFFLLKVKSLDGAMFLQDGPHVKLLKANNQHDDASIIEKIMNVLQEKSAWWFITEILDLSQEINFDLGDVEIWN